MSRPAVLLFFLLSSLSYSLSAQELSSDDRSIVMKVNAFDEEANMAIYKAFEKDNSLAVINSCDVLGLVVFAPSSSSAMSKAQGKSYVSVKMNELKAEVPEGFEFIDGLDASEVLLQCRQKMQELYEEAR